jgi:hypothetical protein
MIAGRTAIYARVSSEAQARENTIASQLASLREHVAADSLMLEPVIVMSTKASAALSLYARRSSDFVMRPLAARSSACMSTLLIAWLGATPIKRCSILLGRSSAGSTIRPSQLFLSHSVRRSWRAFRERSPIPPSSKLFGMTRSYAGEKLSSACARQPVSKLKA